MDQGLSSAAELEALGGLIDDWLAVQLAENPTVISVETDRAESRWYVRVNGEQKDVYAVWFTLGQRSLRYETYVMPAPEENHAAFYQHLLVRNARLVGLQFAIGDEDAVFLMGQLANRFVDEEELDRILGTFYATVEQCFVPALRLGFASRMAEAPPPGSSG